MLSNNILAKTIVFVVISTFFFMLKAMSAAIQIVSVVCHQVLSDTKLITYVENTVEVLLQNEIYQNIV